MLRTLVLVPVFVLLALCRAQAAPLELCPGQTGVAVPLHHAHENGEGVADTQFGLLLHGEHARSVAGTLTILSAGKLYTVPFAAVALAPVVYHAQAARGEIFHYTTFESAPVYFSFPQAAPVAAVWISAAGADGATPAACPALPASAKPSPVRQIRYTGGTTADQIVAMAPTSPPAAAYAGEAPMQGCAHAFVYAKATALATPEFPIAARDQGFTGGTTLVRIVLDERGSIRDATVLAGTGFAMIDDAALRAARISRYDPALLMCKAVPGVYAFRANFML